MPPLRILILEKNKNSNSVLDGVIQPLLYVGITYLAISFLVIQCLPTVSLCSMWKTQMSTHPPTNRIIICLSIFSGIEDLGARIDFDYLPNPNHYVKFGLNYVNHTFFPGQMDLQEEESEEEYYYSFDTSFVFSDRIYADDISVYLEDDMKIGERLKVNIGLHASAFNVNGKNYLSLQPRIQARYLITEDWALKASYAEMQQNVHLLTNSDAGLPTDIWVPATDKVKPQLSKQVSASLSRVLKEGMYELSVEGYYKTMSDLISYKEGSSFLSFQDWQETVETGGQGESYGLEVFLQKKKGKTSGWIGYTLSWANRRFNNINFGEWYSYKYDRRHDISVVLSHTFSENFDMGFTWIYGTGNAISFPQATYWSLGNVEYGNTIEYFGKKNSSRMNAYHRMDLAANFHKVKKRGTRTVSVGLYNAYNRKNPYFVYLGYNNGQKTARQISLFPVIPSITYNFKF